MLVVVTLAPDMLTLPSQCIIALEVVRQLTEQR